MEQLASGKTLAETLKSSVEDMEITDSPPSPKDPSEEETTELSKKKQRVYKRKSNN